MTTRHATDHGDVAGTSSSTHRGRKGFEMTGFDATHSDDARRTVGPNVKRSAWRDAHDA